MPDRMRGLRRAVRPLEAWEIRRFGRSGLSVLMRTPVLVLETTGRRSGRTRSTPLAYRRAADGTFLLAGGAGGQTRLPDWVANLRADPAATVVVRRTRIEVTAEELDGPDRERAWADATAAWPRVATYEQRAGRPVPLLRLTEA